MADANANYYILNYEMRTIDDIKELVVDGLVRDSVIQCSVWPSGIWNVLDAIHCGSLQS